MTRLVGLDTSVAIPLLVQTHSAHELVVTWWDGQPVSLCGHALAETYSVLTHLPGDVRLEPRDAARLMAGRFAEPLTLSAESAGDLPTALSSHRVAGGAVYDAMVALAAIEHDVPLATRDRRATDTYHAVGARVLTVARLPRSRISPRPAAPRGRSGPGIGSVWERTRPAARSATGLWTDRTSMLTRGTAGAGDHEVAHRPRVTCPRIGTCP